MLPIVLSSKIFCFDEIAEPRREGQLMMTKRLRVCSGPIYLRDLDTFADYARWWFTIYCSIIARVFSEIGVRIMIHFGLSLKLLPPNIYIYIYEYKYLTLNLPSSACIRLNKCFYAIINYHFHPTSYGKPQIWVEFLCPKCIHLPRNTYLTATPL